MEKQKEKIPLKQRKKGERGITLIALVVTIVVLLILAAVSITALLGENGLITRAKLAEEKTNQSVQNDIAAMEELNQQLEELVNKESKTAGEVLKVNPEATDKSPYVKYNNMLCRVLYNDAEHGIQIVTADNKVVPDVTLGYIDDKVTAADFNYDGSLTLDENFKKAAASYNKAVDNLNKRADEYKDTKGIAKDARSLGSKATLVDGKFQGDTSGMYTGTYTYFETYKWNGKFKKADTNYKEDVDQLKKLGLNATSGTWLASLRVDSSSNDSSFYVRGVIASGMLTSNLLCVVDSNGDARAAGSTYGFRPVFLLSSDVVISSGDGSSEKPYVIE